MTIYYERKCNNCGKQYKGQGEMFCGPICRASERKIEPPVKICKICPKPISYSGPYTKYCCPAHYNLDMSRYSGESIADAIKRKFKKLHKTR
jgi:hypothetical protein